METDKVLDPPDAPTGMKLRRRARKGKPSKLEEEIDEQREIRQIGLKEKRDKTRIVRLEKRKRNVLTNSTRRKDNVGKMGKYYLRAVKLNAKVIGQLQDMVEQNEEPESSNMTQEEDICADIVNAWNSLTTNPIMAYRNFTQFFEAVTFLSIEKYNRITSHLLSELLDVHAKRGRKSAITDQLPVYLFENDQVDIALGIYKLEKQRGNVDDEPPQKRKRLKGKNVENINETVSSEDTSIETIEIVSYASEPDNTAAELLSKNEQDIDEESNVLQESKFTAKHSFEKFVGFIQQDNTKESSVLAKQMIKDGRQLAEPIKRIHLGNSTEEANFQDFIEIEKEESKFKAWEFEKLNCELAEEKKIAPFVKEFCNAHLISDKVLTECEEIKLNDMKMLIEMEKYRTHSLFLDIPASANVEQSEITLSSNILCHQESKISEGNAANEEELKPEKLVLYSNTNRIEHGRMEAEIKNDEPMEVVDGSFTFIMSPKNEETMARINHKIYETDFRCVREEHFSEESSSIDHGICEEKMLPPFVLEDETELTAKTFEHKNSETFVAIDESESDEKDKNLIASVESVGTEKILGPQSKFLYCSNTNEDKNEEHMIIDTTPSETVNVVTIKSANECEIEKNGLGNSLASTSCNIILVKEDLSHKTLSKCASGTVEIEDRIPDSKSESYAECTIEIRDLQQSDEKCCNSNEISGKPHGQLVVLENSVTTEEASRNIVMGNHLNALKNLPNETLSAEYELTLLDSDTDKINVNYEDSENESNNKPRKAAASNDELKPTPSKNVDVQDFMLSSQFEICKNLSSSPDSDENEADRDLENSPSQDNSDDEDPWLNLLYENAIKLDREQYESPEIEIIFDSNDEIKKTEFCQAPTPNQKKSSAAHCEEYPNKQIACQFQSSKSDDLTKHQMWEGIPGPNAESLQHWTEHPMHKIAHENGSNSNKKCEEHSITVIQQFPSVPRKDVDQNHQEQIFEKAQHEFTQQPPISDHDRQSMGFQHGNQNTIRFEHQKNELETNFSWNQSQWQQHMEPGLQYMQNSAFSGSQVTRDQTRMLPSIEVFSQDQQLGGFNFQNQFYLHQEKNPQEDRMRNQPQSSDRQNIQINSHIRQHLQHYHIIQPFEQTQAHSSSFNHVVTINNS
uniref:Uncharacterized protein n=1 Tax=Caenorhabditis japonica TaxID=281687 RepID=A0A8R1DQJ2_CAEJA